MIRIIAYAIVIAAAFVGTLIALNSAEWIVIATRLAK